MDPSRSWMQTVVCFAAGTNNRAENAPPAEPLRGQDAGGGGGLSTLTVRCLNQPAWGEVRSGPVLHLVLSHQSYLEHTDCN